MSFRLFISLRVSLAMLLPATYLVLVKGDWALSRLLMVLVFGYAGIFLPRYWLSNKVGARQSKIRRSLPDALDLVVVSMEAGLSLDAAFAKVVERTTGPLAQELQRALREIQLGKSRRDALREMAQRCGVKELSTLIKAITQADQMGVSMAELMRTQADESRLQRRQRAEEKANQASVKMVIPLVLFILPTVLIVAAGPAFLTAYRAFFGTGGVFH